MRPVSYTHLEVHHGLLQACQHRGAQKLPQHGARDCLLYTSPDGGRAHALRDHRLERRRRALPHRRRRKRPADVYKRQELDIVLLRSGFRSLDALDAGIAVDTVDRRGPDGIADIADIRRVEVQAVGALHELSLIHI